MDFKVGDIIKAKVTGIEQYGIFVKCDDDYTGLIHISEIDNSFIRDINNYVSIGEEIYVNIIGIDEANKHLSLSIKNMNYNNNADSKVKESVSGFLPLYNHLNEWIEEKLKEINSKNEKNSDE